MNEQRLPNIPGFSGGGALTTDRNRVLRNTYWLLALSMVPTVLGAWVGVSTGITAMLGGGMSAILVEQDVTRALGAAAQFICLAEGRVTLAGSPKAYHRDQISAAYFGT